MSEISHAFNEKPVYLYFKNISKDIPFAVINPDSSILEQKIKSFDMAIPELSCLIVQFKNEITSEDKYFVNLHETPHTMNLIIN